LHEVEPPAISRVLGLARKFHANREKGVGEIA